MNIFVGIDVGLDGAVAIITPDKVVVFDTPTFVVEGKKKNKREFDIPGMVKILGGTPGRPAVIPVIVGIEAVHSMPEQGIVGAFSFGRGLGLWEGIVAAIGFSCQMVTPQRWKKVMLDGMPKGKGASLVVAKRLFPSLDLHRVKDHGRADALLIAEYIRRAHGGS